MTHLDLVSQSVLRVSVEDVHHAVEVIRRARMVWIVGNGGSAATASHFANDLVKMSGIPATSLPDQTAAVMAYGNDTGWENMFAGYLRDHMSRRDVLVAISCSGRSPNVLRAVEAAKEMGAAVVALTGRKEGNLLAGMEVDACICVERADIRVQEDVHLAVCHMIAGEMVVRHSHNPPLIH